MKFYNSRKTTSAAFTLIELLVVIGIIAALAGGVGLALRDNNPGSALRGAQGLTVSALSSARGQAALTQANAKLIVQADKTNVNFLRAIRIVTTTDNGANWKQVGGEIILPSGVYIVPNGTVPGLTLDPAGWGRKSTFFSATAPTTVTGITASDGLWISSGWISPLGVLTTGSGSTIVNGYIVVASGKITGPDAVTLDNYESLRGVDISRYGVATLVNEADSFGN
jgi:prepilin-type N-terminal cleavage/methylation domain-containing protein